jgi:hypothetical protein
MMSFGFKTRIFRFESAIFKLLAEPSGFEL